MKVFDGIAGQDKFLPDVSLLLPLVTHSLKELQGRGIGQVEPQSLNNPAFHILKFLNGIRIISNIDVVVHFGWVNFFVLAGDPQTCHSD